MDGFPAKYCRVVASCVEGDEAYVLLDTGSGGRRYLYGVNCSRRDGYWHEGTSGNGGGWSSTDDRGRGTISIWGDAPPGADMVRIEFEGSVIEQPILEGVYLAAWFKREPSELSWPRVLAFRIKLEWTPQ